MMSKKDNTEQMIQELKEAWLDKDATILFPQGMKYDPEWHKINRDSVKVVKYQQHPDPIRPVSEEWEVIVHNLFRLAVVKNQNGFYFEQLKFN